MEKDFPIQHPQSSVLPSTSSTRYEVVRSLGEKDEQHLFLVRDLVHEGEFRALKIFDQRYLLNPDSIEHFKSELENLKTVEHPNLIRYCDLYEQESEVGYLMEFVPGTDLATLLEAQRPSYEEVDRVCLQILEAVQQLHNHGILHRDISLEHILLGPQGVIKLGAVRLISRKGTLLSEEEGSVPDNIRYMPPEFIKRGKFDVQGDVYSVGVVLLELLTARRRLGEMTDQVAFDHLMKTRFELSEMFLSDLPVRYRQILKTALNPELSQRYQSALEMRDAILTPSGQVQNDLRPIVLKSRIRLGTSGQSRPMIERGVRTRARVKPPERRNLFMRTLVFSFVAVFASFLIFGASRQSSIETKPVHVEWPPQPVKEKEEIRNSQPSASGKRISNKR